MVMLWNLTNVAGIIVCILRKIFSDHEFGLKQQGSKYIRGVRKKI
jgi:hypothetical protein